MHVFLDLDGTLTDPRQGITRSVVYALEEMDLPVPDPDSLTWMIGPALIDSFAKLGADDPERALAFYRKRYADVGLFENSVYAGIPDALRVLQRRGFELNLATAKPHVYARRITDRFDLSGFLTNQYGPELDGTRNDKGELLAHALSLTGTDPKQSVMVGDRIHDINAARSVGMRSIAVTWGYGSAEETAQADILCESPGDLPAIIASILQDTPD